MTTDEQILALAPTDLPVLRPLRFDGDGMEVPLDRFVAEDKELLHRVYRDVEELSLRWKAMGAAPDWAELGRRAAALGKGPLLAQAQALGRATRAAGRADADARKALHDIRGGGLAVLLGVGQLLAYLPHKDGLARTCAAAARDHAKIMRCLLPDLDPPARAADEADKAHGIGHFVDKWSGATMHGPGGPVAVSMRCGFRGTISARCLETAAIDRVVYNLMNNAARFAADGKVELAVLPVGEGLTRWVVSNRVAETEAEFLAGTEPSLLFGGGVTRGGNGVGLANCAEVVADCFGLPTPADAAKRGHIGAKVRGSVFHAFFHWPACEER